MWKKRMTDHRNREEHSACTTDDFNYSGPKLLCERLIVVFPVYTAAQLHKVHFDLCTELFKYINIQMRNFRRPERSHETEIS